MKRLLLSLTACFAMLVYFPSMAQSASTKTSSVQLIILGGGKTYEEAEKFQNAFKDQLLWTVEAPDGFPSIVESKNFKGLNPGFFITVLGGCLDKAQATHVIKELNKISAGAYSREVTNPTEQYRLCPNIGAPSEDQRNFVKEIKAHPKSVKPLLNYAEHLKDQGLLFQAEWVLEKVFQLDPQNAEAKNLAELIMVLRTN